MRKTTTKKSKKIKDDTIFMIRFGLETWGIKPWPEENESIELLISLISEIKSELKKMLKDKK